MKLEDTKLGSRVYLYARVSTPEVAEKAVSLLAQLENLRAYATPRGYLIIEEFAEADACTAGNERREFQRMIVQALSTPRPVDIILVSATSRFMRDVDGARLHSAKLKKHGIHVAATEQAIPALHIAIG